MLLSHREQFVRTFAEKLTTYALGRGLEYYDMPAVRKILRECRGVRLQVVVDHSRHRQEHAVPDANGARSQKSRLAHRSPRLSRSSHSMSPMIHTE